MFDSASGSFPAGATDILLPSDGTYAAHNAAIKARFPNATFHYYSAIGSVFAPWIDVEPGCVWPEQSAVDKWRQWHNQGFYCAKSTKPLIQALLRPGENPEWFEADPNGIDHVLNGDVATQFKWAGLYDVTETTPAFESGIIRPTLSIPKPVPLQSLEMDDEMVIIKNIKTGQYATSNGVAKHPLAVPLSLNNYLSKLGASVDLDPADYDSLPTV